MNWILIAAWTLAILSGIESIDAARDKDGTGWRLVGFVIAAFLAFVSYKLFTL